MVSGTPFLPHRLMGARGSPEITTLMGPFDRYALAQLLQQRGKEPSLDPGWSMIPGPTLTTLFVLNPGISAIWSRLWTVGAASSLSKNPVRRSCAEAITPAHTRECKCERAATGRV